MERTNAQRTRQRGKDLVLLWFFSQAALLLIRIPMLNWPSDLFIPWEWVFLPTYLVLASVVVMVVGSMLIMWFSGFPWREIADQAKGSKKDTGVKTPDIR